MDKYWYSCYGDGSFNNMAFWTWEWQKHGTCQPLGPSLYFRNTIDIFLEAYKKDWYGCCFSSGKDPQCLIHINKADHKWTGRC